MTYALAKSSKGGYPFIDTPLLGIEEAPLGGNRRKAADY